MSSSSLRRLWKTWKNTSPLNRDLLTAKQFSLCESNTNILNMRGEVTVGKTLWWSKDVIISSIQLCNMAAFSGGERQIPIQCSKWTAISRKANANPTKESPTILLTYTGYTVYMCVCARVNIYIHLFYSAILSLKSFHPLKVFHVREHWITVALILLILKPNRTLLYKSESQTIQSHLN